MSTGSCLSMVEFLKALAKTGGCGDCSIVPVLPWYRDALKEGGRQDLAGQVDALADQPALTGEAIAEKLDAIKAQVGEPLRGRLAEFDCGAQEALLQLKKGGD